MRQSSRKNHSGQAVPVSEESIPTWLLVISLKDVRAGERRLRTGEPAVIARIENDRLVIDLRTVFPQEEAQLVQALKVYANSGCQARS